MTEENTHMQGVTTTEATEITPTFLKPRPTAFFAEELFT